MAQTLMTDPIGMPVVEFFEREGKVVKIMATKEPEEVYENVRRGMVEKGFTMRK